MVGEMQTSEGKVDISQMPLSPRQREVWELSYGLGENKQPMRAKEISEKLGISTNSVYVHRRRVRKMLEDHGFLPSVERQPKRIIRQTNSENRMDNVVQSLQAELDGYNEEEKSLKQRLEQIEKEKPELEAALERLKVVQSNHKELTAVA